MHRQILRGLGLTMLLALALAPPALGQPFGTPGRYLWGGGGDGYVEIPSSPAFNSGNQITIEFWQRFDSTENGCHTMVSKGQLDAIWVGHCRSVLRSYLRGWRNGFESGTIPIDGFPHHIAVTYDGHARRHYIDGELVGVLAESGPLVATGAPIRLLFDAQADAYRLYGGLIFELRWWSVARTQAQIRQTMTREIAGPMPGLVAVWHLRDDSNDAVGGHHGGWAIGTAQWVEQPAAFCYFADACFLGRFAVLVSWHKYGDPAADGHRELAGSGRGTAVAGASENSALFWFFDPPNWELLAKVLPACGLNGRYWVYSAATTDQHYALWVTDTFTNTTRVYVNFVGAPAPAITDSSAFATCP